MNTDNRYLNRYTTARRSSTALLLATRATSTRLDSVTMSWWAVAATVSSSCGPYNLDGGHIQKKINYFSIYSLVSLFSIMNSVPSEILQDVFRKCESNSDLINCSLVCKRWSCLALELLWYKPTFHVHYNGNLPAPSSWITFFTIIQATQQTTFPYASFIRRINLSPLSILIEDLHVMTLRSCKRLERLTLAGCSKLTDVGLCTLIHEIGPKLVSLDLSDVYQVTDATITEAAKSCPQLQGFNLSMSRSHHSITDTSITLLAAQCVHMKRVCKV